MNRISETKQFGLRRMWVWRTQAGRLVGLFGLGVLLLLVGYLSSIWVVPVHDPSQAEVAAEGWLPIAGDLTPVGRDHAGAASRRSFGQVFDLGSIRDNDGRPVKKDRHGDPVLPPLRVWPFITNPTFPLFGHTIELFGRLWLVKGQRQYIVVYLEMRLSGSLE